MDISTIIIVKLLLLFSTLTLILAARNELLSPPNAGCACPNEHLIFNCTTVGSAGSTIWRVTAFDCIQNEIILRHSEFDDVGGTAGVCNRGTITGRSKAIDGNCYTSQLNLTVSRELHNEAVICLLNLNSAMTTIRSVTIIVMSELYNDAPSGIQLTDVSGDKLTFSWNPVDSNCLPTNRSIMFDCGTCRATLGTTATCTDLQIPSTCDFSIQNVICGQLGSTSTPVPVVLRVPSKPNVSIIPIYSADNHTLIRLNASVEQEASFSIAPGMSGSVTTYNFYSDNFTLISTSCVDNNCYSIFVDIATFLCSSSADVTVTLSALNRLGPGPPSDPTTIGCINQFVRVRYDPALSAIVCEFLNQTDLLKSCTVSYGQRSQMPDRFAEQSSTLNSIILGVDSKYLEYYNVTASSNEVTVVVEGRQTISAGDSDTVITIIVPAVIALIAIIAVIVAAVTVTLIVMKAVRKKSANKDRGNSKPMANSGDIGMDPLVDKHRK